MGGIDLHKQKNRNVHSNIALTSSGSDRPEEGMETPKPSSSDAGLTLFLKDKVRADLSGLVAILRLLSSATAGERVSWRPIVAVWCRLLSEHLITGENHERS